VDKCLYNNYMGNVNLCPQGTSLEGKYRNNVLECVY
jgi:type IV secretory pathway VirB10-like protein